MEPSQPTNVNWQDVLEHSLSKDNDKFITNKDKVNLLTHIICTKWKYLVGTQSKSALSYKIEVWIRHILLISLFLGAAYLIFML